MSLIATDQTLSGSFDAFKESGPLKTGLPPSAYTDEKFWEAEKAKLFPASWVLVGFAHEMAKSGDTVPVTVGDSPLILVRNQDGSIKAFHNVCRHRCLKLVDSPQNVGRLLKCPYHAWAYGLDGALRSTPYFGGEEPNSVPEGFDPQEHGLKEVQCAVWYDWIFVNVSGDAQPFDEFVAPLKNRLDGLDFEKAKLVGVIDLGIVDTNWKFLMENFIEPYHVQFVHSSTTDQPLIDHYIVDDGHCQGSAVDLDDENEGGDGSGNTLAVSSRYLTLFPTFVFGRYFPDQMGVHLNIPVGPGKTLQRRAIYMTDGTELDTESAEKLKQLWIDVHKEDHEVCIRLQEGRKSTVADGGVLSTHWESSVRNFQEQVLEAVSK
ncbi:aromatic ring-hydroxylating oxygenase subunit alpha [Amphritea sp. HPY]|uniref:aromatic ring-hydroxylating oxygenase subunit alpha n=1 Tax=Amphritea sp. HPY TaxID=3421652 RepID=UPI003D7ED764